MVDECRLVLFGHPADSDDLAGMRSLILVEATGLLPERIKGAAMHRINRASMDDNRHLPT